MPMIDTWCAQIHLQKDGQVHLYSRNCEDRSQSFPDVADATRAAAAGARTHLKPDPQSAESLLLPLLQQARLCCP